LYGELYGGPHRIRYFPGCGAERSARRRRGPSDGRPTDHLWFLFLRSPIKRVLTRASLPYLVVESHSQNNPCLGMLRVPLNHKDPAFDNIFAFYS
jgi:hypothetical protein